MRIVPAEWQDDFGERFEQAFEFDRLVRQFALQFPTDFLRTCARINAPVANRGEIIHHGVERGCAHSLKFFRRRIEGIQTHD